MFYCGVDVPSGYYRFATPDAEPVGPYASREAAQAATQADARQLAVDHCARYGKVVKFLGVQPNYGGYVSFACRWVPYGAAERPLRTLY